jgi:hypothetical protein
LLLSHVSNLTGREQVAEQAEMRREQVRRLSNNIDDVKERESPAATMRAR